MNALALAVDAFHFIRPLWLIPVPVIAVVWWIVRHRIGGSRETPPDGLAPHLRTALQVGAADRRLLRPIDGVAAALILSSIGAAGPTWSRLPDPFVAQSAPVVIALKVTPSMEETDVAPSRLERGKQKIRDLLQQRAGARTALVAYAGTAHMVVPMTDDPALMVPYLQGLTPDVMPAPGNQAAGALQLAENLLAQGDTPGGILFVADSVDPADVAQFNETTSSLTVLSVLPEDKRDRGLDALSVPVVSVTPDGSDIRQVDGLLNADYRQALLENSELPWDDRGYWLAWPAAFLILIWFRRGWTMRWAAVAILALGLTAPQPAQARGIADWFLTPDQQGWIAFQRKDFGKAAELFTDPLWRGYALYRNGQYEKAVEVLDRLDTAEAAFIQGMAQMKSRAYRDGVRSFETVLSRDPDYPDAASNLEAAKVIVDYVERVREQSDTGEEQGIGADEVVFDNEANRGVETQMEASQEEGIGLMTTGQWMNTVDTRTSDFLRQRFAVEAAQRTGSGAAE